MLNLMHQIFVSRKTDYRYGARMIDWYGLGRTSSDVINHYDCGSRMSFAWGNNNLLDWLHKGLCICHFEAIVSTILYDLVEWLRVRIASECVRFDVAIRCSRNCGEGCLPRPL